VLLQLQQPITHVLIYVLSKDGVILIVYCRLLKTTGSLKYLIELFFRLDKLHFACCVFLIYGYGV
jgi:hypothetical protein